jgi:hypothetical protein
MAALGWIIALTGGFLLLTGVGIPIGLPLILGGMALVRQANKKDTPS